MAKTKGRSSLGRFAQIGSDSAASPGAYRKIETCDEKQGRHFLITTGSCYAYSWYRLHANRIISTYDALSLTRMTFHLACAIDTSPYPITITFTLKIRHSPGDRRTRTLPVGVRLSGRVDPWQERRRHPRVPATSTADISAASRSPCLSCSACSLLDCRPFIFSARRQPGGACLFTLLPTTLADAGLGTTDMALASTTVSSFPGGDLWAEACSKVATMLMALFTASPCCRSFPHWGIYRCLSGLATLCLFAYMDQGFRQIYLLFSATALQDICFGGREYTGFRLGRLLLFLWMDPRLPPSSFPLRSILEGIRRRAYS